MAVVGSGIAGDVSVKVQEPITFGSASGISGDSLGNGAVIYNDDTNMTVNASTRPGDSYQVNLVLKNGPIFRSQRV